MLDHTQDGSAVPHARVFAQVRAAFAAKNLSATLADATLNAVGDADKASRMAGAVAKVTARAKQAKADAAEIEEIVTELLAETEDEAGFLMAAGDKIVAKWKAKGDTDTPMPGRPTYGVGASWDHGDGYRQKAIAGLTAKLTGKPRNDMEREAAASLSIPDMAIQCARMIGERPFSAHEALLSGGVQTRSDFPHIIDGALNNFLARGLEEAPIALERVVHVVERSDYRPSKLARASATTKPTLVVEGAEIKSVTLSDTGEDGPQLEDYAGILRLSNKVLTDDRTGALGLTEIGQAMLNGMMQLKRDILLAPLIEGAGLGRVMSDGATVFHASHGNVSTGAALTVSSLGAARTLMQRQKGLTGEPTPVTPRFLVIPPELEMTALTLMASLNASTVADVNPLAGSLEIVVEPGLPSTTAWYLVGDPNRGEGLTLAYLDGFRRPLVESAPAWTTLGREWRTHWPMDATFTGWQTWFRNPGA